MLLSAELNKNTELITHVMTNAATRVFNVKVIELSYLFLKVTGCPSSGDED